MASLLESTTTHDPDCNKPSGFVGTTGPLITSIASTPTTPIARKTRNKFKKSKQFKKQKQLFQNQ